MTVLDTQQHLEQPQAGPDRPRPTGGSSLNRLDFRKIFLHPAVLDRYLREGVYYPYHLSVGLTNRCNHRCRWCYAEYNRGTDLDIDVDVLMRALDDAVAWGLKAVTMIGEGESPLHAEFVRAVRDMVDRGLDIGLFTNGSRLDGDRAEILAEHATFVRISLDAATPETHHACHGTRDFDRIIGNIGQMVRLRGGRSLPTLGIQFATNQINVHEVMDAARMARDLGVDYVAYKPVYKNACNPNHDRNVLKPSEVLARTRPAVELATDAFAVYLKEEQFCDVLGRGPRGYDRCLAHSVSPSINENGDVITCCSLEKQSRPIGNIYQQPLRDIWWGPAHRQFIEGINVNRCPRGCKYHRLNLLLTELFEPDPQWHPNFI